MHQRTNEFHEQAIATVCPLIATIPARIPARAPRITICTVYKRRAASTYISPITGLHDFSGSWDGARRIPVSTNFPTHLARWEDKGGTTLMTEHASCPVYGCNNARSARRCSASHQPSFGLALPLGTCMRLPFFWLAWHSSTSRSSVGASLWAYRRKAVYHMAIPVVEHCTAAPGSWGMRRLWHKSAAR